MAYRSQSFKEHHQTRLPLLRRLVELGWDRGQIICPSPESDDGEWHVPKTPSEAAKREAGQRFQGFPVDVAIFSAGEFRGDYEHVSILIECKEPSRKDGVSQLKVYLGLEPHARLGIWTNGRDFVRVYKLPRAGSFRTIEGAGLPRPGENFILADDDRLTYKALHVPTAGELRATFSSLLGIITSRDTKSTRREDQLSQISNMLLLKLDSDRTGQWNEGEELSFQLRDTPEATRTEINRNFFAYKAQYPALFSRGEPDEIVFDSDTIQEIVFRLQHMDIGVMAPAALSMAFQVFRDAALKLGDGQYYTPLRVIESGVALMELTHRDVVMDPACGTGGFLSEAIMTIAGKAKVGSHAVTHWAHHKLFGVDRDRTNVKLTRAFMVGIGDGSTNAHHGDSLRESKWKDDERGIQSVLGDGRYTVVLTNPPFGKDLVINAADARSSRLEICRHRNGKKSEGYAPTTELGIAFVERAWRLLQDGGRLGIILPETYFFSKSYDWFRVWLDEHFILRGVMNVPMEAFQGFCRAKTNFYVLEKIGSKEKAPEAKEAKRPPRPSWFRDGYTWVSNAQTIGLNKDGLDLFVVDEEGRRTGAIDNKAALDVQALLSGEETETSGYVRAEPMSASYVAVPAFSGDKSERVLEAKVAEKLPGFRVCSLGELIDRGVIRVRGGHGSPSADIRSLGDIPYIKVSDLRAGRVNPNSTNMVSQAVAENFWRGADSGLRAWEIATPSRASKNIGEPAMILPGQERMVLTKEILLFSISSDAPIDPFFLFWAMSLREVQTQWRRVVFMQTNREDLGDRYRLIKIPYTENRNAATRVSEGYANYFKGLDRLRQDFENMKNDL